MFVSTFPPARKACSRGKLLCALFLLLGSQAVFPSQTGRPAAAGDKSGDTIRVQVEVVSVDAIVTDQRGQHVMDLGPEDFEVYQDGRLQRITNLTYVDARVPEEDVSKPVPGGGGPNRPEDVRRSIAILVDDIGMSFENVAHVRDSLRKFVDTQLDPSDLVSISPTGYRTGILQAFTGNKKLLSAAVDNLRWRPPFRASPFDRDAFDRQFSPIKRSETVYERSLAVGTLGTIRFIADSMRDLPGRKSIILVSEGFRTLYRELEGVEGSTDLMVEALNRVTQSAHRAGVVIYTIDARPLDSLGLNPADDLSGVVRLAQTEAAEIEQREDRRASFVTKDDLEKLLSPQAYDEITATRLHQFRQTEQGLNYLPRATGGLYLSNTNDLNQSLARVLSDQLGYYLIGYAPEPSGLRKRRSRPRISVRVTRPGLQVRFRSTFMGMLAEEKRDIARDAGEEMVQLIQSPFGSTQIPLKLTALYERSDSQVATVSCLLHIGSEGLTFQDQEDGWTQAEIEVLAVTYGADPGVVDQKSQTYRVRIRGETLERVRHEGVVYRMTVPVRRPGAHQLRIAVRDTLSGRVGSASQFVEVPDLKTRELAVSGMVVQGTPGSNEPVGSPDEVRQAGMAVRRFRHGMRLHYALYVYNALLDEKTGLPSLESQVVLFRDGQPAYVGRTSVHQFASWDPRQPLMASGYVDIGHSLSAGDYVLEYRVADRLAPAEAGTASQWIDFEVVQ